MGPWYSVNCFSLFLFVCVLHFGGFQFVLNFSQFSYSFALVFIFLYSFYSVYFHFQGFFFEPFVKSHVHIFSNTIEHVWVDLVAFEAFSSFNSIFFMPVSIDWFFFLLWIVFSLASILVNFLMQFEYCMFLFCWLLGTLLYSFKGMLDFVLARVKLQV